MSYATVLRRVLAAGALLLHAQSPAQSLGGAHFAHIDRHALAAQPAVESSVDKLAQYLTQPARNEVEKARAIYRWITDRIVYDVDAYFGKKQISTGADDVLAHRSSICDGFSRLFEQLGKAAGLEVVSIRGFAKGYGGAALNEPDKPNHAWNAVRIGGQWRLIDATWGAGHVRDGQYRKVLSEAYFMAPPEQLMFSHFPVDAAWQLQSMPRLTRPEFDALPELEPALFHTGVSGEAVWKALKQPGFKGSLVRTFDMPFRMVQVLQAPLTYHLDRRQTHDFAIQSEAFEKMALVQGDKWSPMQASGNVFSTAGASLANGELLVMGKKPGTNEYVVVLAYQVE